CFPISVINEQHGKTVEQTEELKEKPTLSIKNTSAKSINSQNASYHLSSYEAQTNASFSGDQLPEMNQQHIIDYIGEELDQNLDNETKSHDNNSTDYNINHCKNRSNNDANGVVTVGPKERYRYAPARNSNISKSSARCNQKLHQRSAGIWSQV
ncbi:hypothetical protein WUBG_06476, partial [Wuchereria bancrofti]